MYVELPLGIDESRVVIHALDVPAAIGETFEDDGFDREAAENAALSMTLKLREGESNILRIESDMEREVLIVALTESTFLVDSSLEEIPIVRARYIKAINSLEAKIETLFNRTINIARD